MINDDQHFSIVSCSHRSEGEEHGHGGAFYLKVWINYSPVSICKHMERFPTRHGLGGIPFLKWPGGILATFLMVGLVKTLFKLDHNSYHSIVHIMVNCMVAGWLFFSVYSIDIIIIIYAMNQEISSDGKFCVMLILIPESMEVLSFLGTICNWQPWENILRSCILTIQRCLERDPSDVSHWENCSCDYLMLSNSIIP